MGTEYRDPDWLEERYHGDGLTHREIAEECGISPRTIRKWISKFEIETRDVVGEHHGLYGEERSEEVKRRISESLLGREFSEETRKRISESQRGSTVPESVRRKISESLSGISRPEETRIKMSRSTAGKQNPNWKGGTYSDDWYGPLWTGIRDRVRKRDRVCQHSGSDGTESGLDVHHIVPIRVFREADDLDLEDANRESNLVLLCKRCHARADHGGIDVTPPTIDTVDEPED